VLGLRAWALQSEQSVELQIGAVRDLVAQNVDTSSDATSSTAIISVVKKGSP
jgi:hypothetical protein